MSSLTLLQPLSLNNRERKSFRRSVGRYQIDITYEHSTENWSYSIWSEREGKNKFIQYEHFKGFANSREKALRKCNRWFVNKL